MASPGTDLQHMLGHLQHNLHPLTSLNTPKENIVKILEEAVVLLDLFSSAIDGNSSSHNERFLMFCHSELINVLLSYVTNLCDTLDTPPVAQELLLKARVAALAALTETISVAHDMDASVVEVPRVLGESLAAENGWECFMDLIEEEPHDALRSAAAEALYAAACRLPGLPEADILNRIIELCSTTVIRDRNTTVRNYAAALLRDLAGTEPLLLVNRGIVQVSVQLLHLDPSPDVRTLACETLDALVRGAPNDCAAMLEGKLGNRLAGVLHQRLQEDGYTGVIEGVCRVLETVFREMVQPVVFEYIRAGGWRALVRSVGGPVRTASLAVRALRHLVLISPGMGTTVVTNFKALSALLKAVHNHTMPRGNGTQSTENTSLGRTHLAQQLLKVELATLMGVIFAQNPRNRKHVHDYLEAFPVWMSNLRTSLLKNLAGAETEYFEDIDLVDDSDYRLIDGIRDKNTFSVDVKNTFRQQEQRFKDEEETSHSNEIDFFDQEDKNLDEETRGRAVAALLSWSIHLTLSTASNPFDSSALSVLNTESHNSTTTTDFNTTGSPNLSPVLDSDRSPRHSRSPVQRTKSKRRKSQRTFMTAKAPVTLFSSFTADFTPAVNASPPKRTQPSDRDTLKIHKSLALCIQFAHFYREKTQIPIEHGHHRTSSVQTSRVKQYRCRKKKGAPSKEWSEEDVEAGDVFWYKVPIENITPKAICLLLERAQKHMKRVKNQLAVAPIRQRGRRGFLYDMEHHIMPKWIELLKDMHRMVEEHGDRLRMVVKLLSPSPFALEPSNTLDLMSNLQRHAAEQVDVDSFSFQNEQDPEAQDKEGNAQEAESARDSIHETVGIADPKEYSNASIQTERDTPPNETDSSMEQGTHNNEARSDAVNVEATSHIESNNTQQVKSEPFLVTAEEGEQVEKIKAEPKTEIGQVQTCEDETETITTEQDAENKESKPVENGCT